MTILANAECILKGVPPEKMDVVAKMLKGFITSAGAYATGLVDICAVKTVLTKKS